MSCKGCGFTEVTPYKPFEKDIVVPRHSDLIIKLQGQQNKFPIDWDSGTLEMHIYQEQDDEDSILYTFDDDRFSRSQSETADNDPNVTWDDVAAILVKNDQELDDLEVGVPYWFDIVFHHTALDIEMLTWRGWLTKDFK